MKLTIIIIDLAGREKIKLGDYMNVVKSHKCCKTW